MNQVTTTTIMVKKGFLTKWAQEEARVLWLERWKLVHGIILDWLNRILC